MNIPATCAPTPNCLSSLIIRSQYTAQKVGFRIAPCLVPFLMENVSDFAWPQFTQPCWSFYMDIRHLTTMGGTPVSSILSKRIENLQKIKSFGTIQHSDYRIGPCSQQVLDNFCYWVVLVLALNPNWRLSLANRWPHSRMMTFSNTLRIRDEPAIDL